MNPPPGRLPDFFLGSTESLSFGEPRACHELGHLQTETGRDLMGVRVSPPLSGELWNEPGQRRDEVLLTNHYKGNTIYPISEWPLYVFVLFVPVTVASNTESVAASDLEILLWGELYPTREAALAAVS